MGNKFSVKLSIVLDHELGIDGPSSPARAGQPLTGKVVAKVRGSGRIQGQLKLLVVGSERTWFSRKEKTSEGDRRFLTVDLTLTDLSRLKLSRGMYEFPFIVQLPECLPSSTSLQGSRGFQVYYELQARAPDLYINRPMLVESAALPVEKVPCVIRPTTHDVRMMGLVNKGSVTLAASVDDTRIGRGGILEVSLVCRNDALVDIHRVEVKLVELLKWKTGANNNNKAEPEGHEKRVLLELKDVPLPCLLKGKRERSEVIKSIRNGIDQQRNIELYEDLRHGVNKFFLTIPQGSRDSYKGQLIDVTHYIKIKLVTNALSDSPSVKIPLKIGYRPNRSSSSTRIQDSYVGEWLLQQQNQLPSPQGLDSSEGTEESYPSSWQQQSQQSQQSQESQQAQEPHGEAVAVVMTVVEPNPAGGQADHEIPMVEAIPVNADGTFVLAPTVSAPPENIVVGGNARSAEDEIDVVGLVPIPPPILLPPSLTRLLEEMSASVKEYDSIQSKLDNAEWKRVIGCLTSEDYGKIIGHVKEEVDQPRIAVLLAPHVNGGSHFTCEFAASAVRHAADWNRSAVTQSLLPLCDDVVENFHLIQSELDEWGVVVTSRSFDAARQRAHRR